MQAAAGECAAWHGTASRRLVEASRRIASAIAERLADPERVVERLAADVAAEGNDGIGPYDVQTFSHGLPGVIALHAELDRMAPERDWDMSADGLIRALADTIQRHGIITAGLFVGASGQAFAIWNASRGETRYRKLLERLDAGVVSLTDGLLSEAWRRRGNCAVSDYDVVQGLSGIGRYLLHRAHFPQIRRVLDATLDYLVELAKPTTRDGIAAPGWFVPQANQMTVADAKEFPSGNFNSGLAHGVAGPLALLSLAYRAGHRRDGQAEAITRIAGWFTDIAVTEGSATKWPARISWPAHVSGTRKLDSGRNAWCYGVPGIARSLYLAGACLDVASFSRLALASLRHLLGAIPPSELALAPTLCHGLAGILQISLRMAADSGDADVARAARSLVEVMVERYDPTSLLGYEDIEEREDGNAAVAKAGFLTGAAGVALTLATYGSIDPPVWDSALLIS
jgi:hypothetical protein